MSTYNQIRWVRAVSREFFISKRDVIDLVMEARGKCFICNTTVRCGIGIDRHTHPDGLTLRKFTETEPASKANYMLVCNTCQDLPVTHTVESIFEYFVETDSFWS